MSSEETRIYARSLQRVTLYNRLIKKYLELQFPDGAPRIGSKEEVLELQRSVFADPQWLAAEREW